MFTMYLLIKIYRDLRFPYSSKTYELYKWIIKNGSPCIIFTNPWIRIEVFLSRGNRYFASRVKKFVSVSGNGDVGFSRCCARQYTCFLFSYFFCHFFLSSFFFFWFLGLSLYHNIITMTSTLRHCANPIEKQYL